MFLPFYFQGLAVSVLYCFLNGEVRTTISSRLNRWQDERAVSAKYTRASTAMTPETVNMRTGSIHSNKTEHTVVGNGGLSASSSMNYTPQWGTAFSKNGAPRPMFGDEALWSQICKDFLERNCSCE